MPVLLLLSLLAACMRRKYTLCVRGGWQEELSLYTVCILPPAERKSAAFSAVYSPFVRLQHEMGMSFSADDVTPEKLAEMLSKRGPLYIASAEGGVFEAMYGRYGASPEVYLKAHDGDPIRVDRIGREAVYCPRPGLSIAVCAQPQFMQEVIQNPALRGRGLIGRFLYAAPPRRTAPRRTDPPPLAAEVSAAYEQFLRRLLEDTLPPDSAPGAQELLPLCFSAEAYALLVSFADETELALLDELEPIGDWAGKLVGKTARIAALLHSADCIRQGISPQTEITAHWTQNAIALARVFTTHAQNVLGEAFCAEREALNLCEKLRHQGFPTLPLSDLKKQIPYALRAAPEHTAAILRTLTDNGYLAVYEQGDVTVAEWNPLLSDTNP
jgi:hypothetical protein